MIRNFKIVKLDSQYCDYLRKFDNRVSYNAGIKELRPYIGVLFEVNTMHYFAPLSSPKPKHIHLKNAMDLIKIDNGKYGVINLNNMLPVTEKNYELFDLNKKSEISSEEKRRLLLKTQLRWLNNHFQIIEQKAMKLYNYYKKGKLPNRIKVRCCDFILLEEKCKEYNQ